MLVSLCIVDIVLRDFLASWRGSVRLVLVAANAAWVSAVTAS